MFFELFACRSTTAPFTSDVLAHAILGGQQFRDIFGNVLTSTVASARPILGTPKEIYDWVRDWCESDGIKVDVLLMEMMDFQRTAPGVPRSMRFRMIHSMSGTPSYGVAALRMAAEIAVVGGKKITPHDFHGGNGLAIPNGLQLYLVDWGGLFNLANPEDRAKLLHIFEQMCKHAFTTESEESTHARQKAVKTADPNKKLLARFPCLQDLCGFFELTFYVPQAGDNDAARNENIRLLTEKFEEKITTGFVDFVCVAPTPQNVHHTLMLVAFIDFMSNRMEYVHPYCQCGDVLRIVYPQQDETFASTTGIDVSTFRDFRTFLRKFTVETLPPSTELDKVVGLMQEIVAPCPSACAALSPQMLRPTWMETKRREIMFAKEQEEKEEAMRFAAAEARRLAVEAEREAIRLAAEAEEARRLAEAAEARRLAAEAAEAKAAEAKATAARKRLEAARKPGVAKPNLKLDTKKSDALDAAKIQSAVAQAQAQGASVQEVAVPTSWLKKVSSKLNPLNWSLPSSWKRTGGTRKHKRNHKRNATKRRHN
jgi:hypothetical protein